MKEYKIIYNYNGNYAKKNILSLVKPNLSLYNFYDNYLAFQYFIQRRHFYNYSNS